MDNFTHTLYGLALAKTGLHRISPQATTTILVGANLPDIDIISLSWGSIGYLKHHRGITHALLGMVVGAAVLASVAFVLNNRVLHARQKANWGKLFLVSLAGTGSHVLLDYTNSYGIRPFLPFNGRWFSWDIVFIIDPWILLVLILGLGLPFLFRLISQEIGARPTEYGRGAFACLILILGYWISKDISHRQTIVQLEEHTYSTRSLLRVGAVPTVFDPYRWNGIAETETAYHLIETGRGLFQNHFEIKKNRIYHKPQQSEVFESARKASQTQIFLDFARYPLFQITPSAQGYTITVRDLRFEYATRRRKGFVCTIEMDRDLKVLSENFRF